MRHGRGCAHSPSTRSGVDTAPGTPVRLTDWPRPDGEPMPTPRFLTLDDVAEILNVSWSQAYALVRRKELIAIQIGGRGPGRGGGGGGGKPLPPKKTHGGGRAPPPGAAPPPPRARTRPGRPPAP